ncbi:MAG: GGDEF domain-containing protein [Sandaracinaceae bacterium]
MSQRPPRHRKTMPEVAEPIGVDGRPQPVLVVLNGAQVGQRIRLEQPALVGRDPESDLMLSDPSVSWHHARLAPSKGDAERWELLPIDPTHLNDRPVATSAALTTDDRITLGNVVLRFEVHGPIEQAYDRAILERLNTDELTGLSTRRQFDERFASMLQAAARRGEPVGLAVLDVDGLKTINDRLGHLAGAHAIGEVGRTLGRALHEHALACRLGGDEFAAAIPNADHAVTHAFAERVRADLEARAVHYEGDALVVRVSCGVSAFPSDGREPKALFAAADRAMYDAKRAGGNRVSVTPRDGGGDSDY